MVPGGVPRTLETHTRYYLMVQHKVIWCSLQDEQHVLLLDGDSLVHRPSL